MLLKAGWSSPSSMGEELGGMVTLHLGLLFMAQAQGSRAVAAVAVVAAEQRYVLSVLTTKNTMTLSLILPLGSVFLFVCGCGLFWGYLFIYF